MVQFTLLRSALIALGLMLGHAAWTTIAVNSSERAAARQQQEVAQSVAYVFTDELVELQPFPPREEPSRLTRLANFLTGAVEASASVAWSPTRLTLQFALLTGITFTIWFAAFCTVRLIACRGAARMSTPLDLTRPERTAPPWLAPAISPVFAFIAALSTGIAATFAGLAGPLPSIPANSNWASPVEHVSWSVAAAFSLTLAVFWMKQSLAAARMRQAQEHAEAQTCARCAYQLSDARTTTCPECGSAPPEPPPRKRARRIRRATKPIILLVAAITAGYFSTGPLAINAATSMLNYLTSPFPRVSANSYLTEFGYGFQLHCFRPVVVQGPSGSVYFVAAPIGTTSQTIIRAVLIPPNSTTPTQTITAIIEAPPPNASRKAEQWINLTDIPTTSIHGLQVRVFDNRGYGATNSEPIYINRFAQPPDRITALPRKQDTLPTAIREILDSTDISTIINTNAEPAEPIEVQDQ